jgi:hypothetical protein
LSLLALAVISSQLSCGQVASNKPPASAPSDPPASREQLLGQWVSGNHDLEFKENGSVLVQERGELIVVKDGKEEKNSITTKHEGTFTCSENGLVKLDFPKASIVLPEGEYRFSVAGDTLTLKPQVDAGMLSGARTWKRK